MSKRQTFSSGDGSVRKVPVDQVWRPEFRYPEPMRKSMYMWEPACSIHTGTPHAHPRSTFLRNRKCACWKGLKLLILKQPHLLRNKMEKWQPWPMIISQHTGDQIFYLYTCHDYNILGNFKAFLDMTTCKSCLKGGGTGNMLRKFGKCDLV